MDTRNKMFPGSVKSSLLKAYDYYHDALVCNQASDNPVFCWFDLYSTPFEISYAQLLKQVDQTASNWLKYGVEPGQLLCILYPFNVDYLVSLFAALKIGCRIALLPVRGNRLIRKRIENLNPDHIAADAMFCSLIPEWTDQLIPEMDQPLTQLNETAYSHSYASAQSVFYIYDTASESPHIATPVPADQAYLNPLRDGLVEMGLRPGFFFSAPGFDPIETQPWLILAGMMSGASYVHFASGQLDLKPDLISHYPIRSIGLDNHTRDVLLSRTLSPLPQWRFWFRNLEETPDFDIWNRFIETLSIDHVPVGNVKWDSASGGISLFSVRRNGQVHLNVFPSAGVPWRLTNIAGSGQEAFGNFGTVSLDFFDQYERELPSMIAGNGKEWIFVGSRFPLRSGSYYPAEDVLAVMEDLLPDFLCSIVNLPVAGSNYFQTVLLVFTGTGRSVDNGAFMNVIQETIKKELGERFCPDRISFFPFYPRSVGGRADTEWCAFQFITGKLYKKTAEDSPYAVISRIREMLCSQ